MKKWKTVKKYQFLFQTKQLKLEQF